MGSFENKVAIVTGAGQGIGFAIARMLVTKGAKVVLNDIDGTLANAAAKMISTDGSCIPTTGDVADPNYNQQMIDQAVNTFGKLDIAIANAGITLYGEFMNYSKEDFDKVVSVNLGGSFFLAQKAAHQMKKQGGGKILFLSSVTGHQAHKHLTAYGMTKAGIEMLARGLVIELSEFRINVNAIAPGATITERTEDMPGYEKGWSKFTPIGKPATPDDIAKAALFLVSDDANHITGQALIVDGGWTAISPSPEADK